MMTLLALPLIFGCFGAAWDFMAYTWVKGEVQANVDAAVAAGATAATTNSKGRLALDRTDFAQVVRTGYRVNRPPFLTCDGSSNACWQTDGAPRVTRNPDSGNLELTWGIREEYKTQWLTFLGLRSIGIDVESRATLGSGSTR